MMEQLRKPSLDILSCSLQVSSSWVCVLSTHTIYAGMERSDLLAVFSELEVAVETKTPTSCKSGSSKSLSTISAPEKPFSASILSQFVSFIRGPHARIGSLLSHQPGRR